MVRKLLLLVVGSMVATALIGATSASALVYDECDGDPWDNTFAFHDLVIDTPDSHKAYAPSAGHTSGTICGTDIGFRSGYETYVKFVKIDLPSGAYVRDTLDSEAGTKAGDARLDLLVHVAGIPQKLYNQEVTTRTAVRPDPAEDPGGLVCPADAGLCWENIVQGIGTQFSWKHHHPTPSFPGQEQLVSGPLVVKVLGKYEAAAAGIVGIDYFNVCGYIEIGNYGSCGGPADTVNGRNGDASTGAGGCVSGLGNKGLFHATAEQNSGATTESDFCITWIPANSRYDWAGPVRR